MFGKPLSELTCEDIKSFCDRKLPEGLIVDYKIDFPSDLPKILASFANTFGGYVLIGIETYSDNTPKIVKGIPFDKGTKEKVTQIALTGIHQPLFPDVGLCKFDNNSKVVVVIYVPPSFSAPHVVIKTNKIPYRVADITEPIRDADIDRIEYLLKRREQPERERKFIVDRANERFNDMKGRQAFRKLVIGPPFPYTPLCGLEETLDILRISKTGLISGSPFPIQDGAGLIFSDQKNYVELNQKGIILLYEILSEEKSDRPCTVKYEFTIRTLSQFIKFIIRCYNNLKFDALVKIDFMLENIGGFEFSYGTQRMNPIPHSVINVSHLTSISSISSQPHVTLTPMIKNLLWACGLTLSDVDIKHNFTSAFDEIL